MEKELFETDVVIIGAGPVGLFSVFELGLLDMKCHVIDILDKPGGQCAELYPEKPIYDIPGMPSVLGSELVDLLMKQIAPFNPTFHFSSMVQEITKIDSVFWEIKTDHNEVFKAKVVVIAGGGGSFLPKKPPIKEIENFENNSVFYSIKNKEIFRDKELAIVGGGDSALDWVMNLEEIAKKITLIHRRDQFRAAPDTVKKIFSLIESKKIDFIIEKQITKDTTNEIKEITILTLEEFGIDLSSLEDFDNYFDPFIAEYLEEMKIEIKELYLDTYSEEEVSAYYQFISQDAGSSFLAKQVLITSDTLDISMKVSQRMMNRLNNRLIRDYPELFEDLY